MNDKNLDLEFLVQKLNENKTLTKREVILGAIACTMFGIVIGMLINKPKHPAFPPHCEKPCTSCCNENE